MLSDGVYEYEYDLEGNRIRRVEIATGEVTEYTWDYRNRLTRVETIDGAGEVLSWSRYAYDAFDRRIQKVYDPDGDGELPVETERFVYDGDHLYLVFDGANTLTERYLHGLGIDQVLAEERNGEVYWTLADHQGSLRDWVDASGAVVQHLVYDSFGNVTGRSEPDFEFRFGYTGREHDSETGLMYYRARYYEPKSGRFISLDPIGFESGDVNLYRYVFNNPLTYTDPSGNVPEWLYRFSNFIEENVHRPVGEFLAGNQTAYQVVDKTDELAAGVGSLVTLGATDSLRADLYGEIATQNHQGAFYNPVGEFLASNQTAYQIVDKTDEFVAGAANIFSLGATNWGRPIICANNFMVRWRRRTSRGRFTMRARCLALGSVF